MKRKRVAVTVSMPPEIASDYNQLAQTESKNKSQLFRDMFALYKASRLEKEFLDLQRYGSRTQRAKRPLTEKEVERIVFEDR